MGSLFKLSLMICVGLSFFLSLSAGSASPSLESDFAAFEMETGVLLWSRPADDPSAPHELYYADVAGNLTPLISAADGLQLSERRVSAYQESAYHGDWLIFSDGRGFNLQNANFSLETPPLPDPPLPPLNERLATPIAPLFPPEYIGSFGARLELYTITGEADGYRNIYALWDGQYLEQLTDIAALFPEAQAPFINASAIFIAMHPHDKSIFSYRARLLDSQNQSFNALFMYDFNSEMNLSTPYFGTTPIWSPLPDMFQLVGGRLAETTEGIPIYELWLADMVYETEQYIGVGCNPRWSPDGAWLVYDQHTDARWQNYVDCFANGEVALYHLESGTELSLTDNLPNFTTLIAWWPPPQNP